MKDRLIEPA